MFVEEGFRIRFANGEVIDFYADSAKQKDEWMKYLCDVVGKDVAGADGKKTWVEVVRARQRQMGKAAPATPKSETQKAIPATQPQVQQKETRTVKPNLALGPPKPPTRRTSRSAPTSPIRGDTFTKPTSVPMQSNTLEEYMMSRALPEQPQAQAHTQTDKPLPQPSFMDRAKEKAAHHMRTKSQPEALGSGTGGGLTSFMRRGDKGEGASGRGRRQMIKSMIF